MKGKIGDRIEMSHSWKAILATRSLCTAAICIKGGRGRDDCFAPKLIRLVCVCVCPTFLVVPTGLC